jgi:hypothetical protein
MLGALSDERPGLLFTIAAGPRQRLLSWVRVRRDSWSYFTVSDSRLPQPGGLGPRNYIPQEQGGPDMPPRHWDPFSSPHDSQGYDGAIRNRFHAGYSTLQVIGIASRYKPSARPRRKHCLQQFLCFTLSFISVSKGIQTVRSLSFILKGN